MDILLKEDFDLTQSKIALGFELSKANVSADPLSETGQYNLLKDHISASPIESVSAEIYEVKDFLSGEECQLLIDQIKSTLRPSTIATSGEYDHSYRTSSTCDLGNLNNPYVDEINRRICNFIGIDPSYGETLQGQHYLEGQEFKEHTDYFEGSQLLEHDNGRGQRTYTFMIYLNDVGENDGAFGFLPVRPDYYDEVENAKKSSKVIGKSGLGILSRIDWWHTATANLGNNDREMIRLSITKNMYHQAIQETEQYIKLREYFKNKGVFLNFMFGGNRKWYKNVQQPKQEEINNISFSTPPLNYSFSKSYKQIIKNKIRQMLNIAVSSDNCVTTKR